MVDTAVESEQRRQQVIEAITRWAKTCKVDHLLRIYDIPGLASSIIEIFYRVQLSCGHWVEHVSDGQLLAYEEENGTVYGTYCPVCAEIYKKEMNAWEVSGGRD